MLALCQDTLDDRLADSSIGIAHSSTVLNWQVNQSRRPCKAIANNEDQVSPQPPHPILSQKKSASNEQVDNSKGVAMLNKAMAGENTESVVPLLNQGLVPRGQ